MAVRRRRTGLAALAILALGACHKRGGDAEAASSRGLQVEAYDPVIAKTPAKGKLETLAEHPEDRPAPEPAPSSQPPAADSGQAPASKE